MGKGMSGARKQEIPTRRKAEKIFQAGKAELYNRPKNL